MSKGSFSICGLNKVKIPLWGLGTVLLDDSFDQVLGFAKEESFVANACFYRRARILPPFLRIATRFDRAQSMLLISLRFHYF